MPTIVGTVLATVAQPRMEADRQGQEEQLAALSLIVNAIVLLPHDLHPLDFRDLTLRRALTVRGQA